MTDFNTMNNLDWPVSLISQPSFLEALALPSDNLILEQHVRLLDQLRHSILEQSSLWGPFCPFIVKNVVRCLSSALYNLLALHPGRFPIDASSHRSSDLADPIAPKPRAPFSCSSCCCAPTNTINSNCTCTSPELHLLRRFSVTLFRLNLAALSFALPLDPPLRMTLFSLLTDFSQSFLDHHLDMCLESLALLTNDGKEISPFERETVVLLLAWLDLPSSAPHQLATIDSPSVLQRDAVLRLIQKIVSFNFALFKPSEITALIKQILGVALTSLKLFSESESESVDLLPTLSARLHRQDLSSVGTDQFSPTQKKLHRLSKSYLATSRYLAQESLQTLDYIIQLRFFPSSLLLPLIDFICRAFNISRLDSHTILLCKNILASSLALSTTKLLAHQLCYNEPPICPDDPENRDVWCRGAVFLLSFFSLRSQYFDSLLFFSDTFLHPCLILTATNQLPLTALEIVLNLTRLLKKHANQLFLEWDLICDLLLSLIRYFDHPALQSPLSRSLPALSIQLLSFLHSLSASLPILHQNPKLLTVFDHYAGHLLTFFRDRAPSRSLRSTSEGDLKPTKPASADPLLLADSPDLDLSHFRNLIADLIAHKASFARPYIDGWLVHLETLLDTYLDRTTAPLIFETVRSLYINYRALHAAAIEITVLNLFSASPSPPTAPSLNPPANLPTPSPPVDSSAAPPKSNSMPAFTLSLSPLVSECPELFTLIETLGCYTRDAQHLARFVDLVGFDVKRLKKMWSHRFKHLGGQHGLFVYKKLVQCSVHPNTEVRLKAARCLAKFGVVKLPGPRRYLVSYGGRTLPNARLYWVRQEHPSNFRLIPFDILFNTALRQIQVEQDPHIFALLQFGAMTFLHNRYAMASGNITRVAELSLVHQPKYLRLITTALGYKATLARENQENIIRYFLQTDFGELLGTALSAFCCAIVELPQAARLFFQNILNLLLQLQPKPLIARAVVSLLMVSLENSVAPHTSFQLMIDILLRFVHPSRFPVPTINSAYRAIALIFLKIDPARRASLLASLQTSIQRFVDVGCPYALATLDLLAFHTPPDPYRKSCVNSLPILLSIDALPSTSSTTVSSSSSSLSSSSSSSSLNSSASFSSENSVAPQVTVRRASGITRHASAFELLGRGYHEGTNVHLTTGDLARPLRLLDLVQPVETFKIAVLLITPAATDEMLILSANVGSPRYHAFLDRLGKLIPLAGVQSDVYCGGLDRTSNASDGKYMLMWQDQLTQVVFLVASLMPTIPGSVLNKKRHIGNCFVTIVYNESSAPFKPNLVLPGQFNTVHIVINPLEGNVNRIEIIKKDEIIPDPIGPVTDVNVVSEEALPTLVRLTALDADTVSRAAYYKTDFAPERVERVKQIISIISSGSTQLIRPSQKEFQVPL